MSHEITSNDNVVLHKQAAWHGLGIVVENAPTPMEALQIAGLDWKVEQWPMSATDGTRKISLKEVANVRTDISRSLGIVTPNYKPIQNSELAEFCQLLAEQSDVVKIESAGSIRHGGKVWFLLKGESFSVRGKDEVRPYICVSNGHDGKTALRCTPTTVRVVCSNTLHMVIPAGGENESAALPKLKQGSYVANHMGDVLQKIEHAKQALGLYGRSLDTTRQMIDRAAAKNLNRADVQKFFIECYTRDFGAIPSEPKNDREKKVREKAVKAYNLFNKRFDEEIGIAGATAWNAINAYTGWLQNDQRAYRTLSERERELRMSSKLFGADSDRAHATFSLGLSS